MGLKLMKDAGVVRRIWYGQYKEKGKWKVTKLTTPMRGTRIPDSLSETGDAAFERSRALAQAEFDRFEDDRRVKGSAEHIARKLIESKTGQPFDDVRISELEARWRQTHARNRTESWDKGISWMFKLFTDSVECRYLYEVTPEMVSDFYKGIRTEYSWSVVVRIMRLIGGAFANLLPIGSVNPFSKVAVVPDKNTQGTIHRKPLSETELKVLFEEARKDPLLYSLTVATACTGMRIGDVCNLEWKSVDMKSGLVDVKTRKTGQEVTIPIFPMFMSVLGNAHKVSDSRDRYVFPAAAEMYANHYTRVIRMGKLLFARALFGNDAEEVTMADTECKALSAAEVIKKIRASGFTKKKAEKVERVYSLYKAGSTYREIERDTGFSRGQISSYLHELEEITGNTIVKYAKECASSVRNLLKKTRLERDVGRHSASLYGWHSLRASFVVQALAANVPIEAVRMVVGHSTTDMTMEYFNPTKRVMAETIRKGLSGSILASGGVSAIAGMIAKMSASDREQLKRLLGK